MSSTEKAKAPLYFGWYICAATVFVAFVSILAAGLLFDITGSYTLPFAIGGALLFPAAISAFSVRESKYSARYQTPLSTAAAAGD